MSHKHILSLEIPETANDGILRIIDSSVYTSGLAVECATIQITSPGFNVPKNINVLPGFNLGLNACTLGITGGDCSDLPKLPDGLYVIRYSVSPNDKVWVEYNYLRVTEILNHYNAFLCKLDLAPCEPTDELKRLAAEANYIKMLIEAAKAKVEYCMDAREGLELLKYAAKKLKALECNKLC